MEWWREEGKKKGRERKKVERIKLRKREKLETGKGDRKRHSD